MNVDADDHRLAFPETELKHAALQRSPDFMFSYTKTGYFQVDLTSSHASSTAFSVSWVLAFRITSWSPFIELHDWLACKRVFAPSYELEHQINAAYSGFV